MHSLKGKQKELLPVKVKKATIHERLSLIPLRSGASSSEIGWFLNLPLSSLCTLKYVHDEVIALYNYVPHKQLSTHLRLHKINKLILKFLADSFFVHNKAF